MMPQSARILTTACPKPAVPLEDCQREYGRVTGSSSPQRSRYTGPSSFPPSCTVQRPGFSIGSRSGYCSGFTNAAWHQMTRPHVKLRSPQESQPAQYRVFRASCAAALGWPRHRYEIRTHAQSSLLQRAPRKKARSRKHYKEQLKRQLTQAGISHQSWQQEASDRNSWRALVRKASCKFEAEWHEAAKEKRRRQKKVGIIPIILNPNFSLSTV